MTTHGDERSQVPLLDEQHPTEQPTTQQPTGQVRPDTPPHPLTPDQFLMQRVAQVNAVEEYRRSNLRRYVYANGGPGIVTQQMGEKTPSYLVQMIGPRPTRPVTERNARRYEKGLGLEHLSLDTPTDVVNDETLTLLLERTPPRERHRAQEVKSIFTTPRNPSPPLQSNYSAHPISAHPPSTPVYNVNTQSVYSSDEFKNVMAMVYDAYKERVSDPSNVDTGKFMRLVDMVFKTVKADNAGQLPEGDNLKHVVQEVVSII